MKRMKHPQHGFHHVYDGNTEATMRSNGWVDDEPEAAPEVADDADSIQTADPVRRRGPNKRKGQ